MPRSGFRPRIVAALRGAAVLAVLAAVTLLAGACGREPDRGPNGAPGAEPPSRGGAAVRLDTAAMPPVVARALARHRGEVVLLDVWTTWCANCAASLRELDALQRELGPRGLRVLAVSVDERVGPARVAAFARQHAPGIEVVHDPSGATGRALGARGVPASVLVGRDGRTVLDFRHGFSDGHAGWSAGDGRRSIDAALAESPPAVPNEAP